MRHPVLYPYKKIMRLLMAFSLGMLVGAGILMFWVGPQYEDSVTENRRLKDEVEKLNTTVAEWEKRDAERKKQSTQTVRDIIVTVGNPGKMSLLEMEVAKKAKKDVEWMIGQPLESVTRFHLGIQALYKNKIYEVDGHRVSVTLETLVIEKNVHLYLRAKVEN